MTASITGMDHGQSLLSLSSFIIQKDSKGNTILEVHPDNLKTEAQYTSVLRLHSNNETVVLGLKDSPPRQTAGLREQNTQGLHSRLTPQGLQATRY